MSTPRNHRQPQREPLFEQWFARLYALLALVIVASGLALIFTPANAAAPAGTLVGNQGSMEFVDAEGVRRTVSSNLIEIEVLQVYSVVLEGGLEKTVSGGGTVTFPHAITNTGNGTDDFLIEALNQAGDGFDFTSIQIFADDGSGQPTGDPITDPVSLPAGETFNFIIVAVAENANAGDRAAIDVTVTSQGDTDANDSAEDGATINNNAIIEIRKSLSSSNGAPGDGQTHTITLTLTNTSGTNASAISLSDVLADGYAYAAESGQWSEDGAALTDANGGDSAGINYEYNSGTNTVSATIDSIVANSSQTVSFQFTIPAGTLAGDLDNDVQFSYDDGTGNTQTSQSNTVSFSVDQVGNSDADDQNPDGSSTSASDEDGNPRNDEIFVATAPQGSNVPFEVIVTNQGNGDDVFNIEIPSDNFPPGTVFTIYKSDGSTPLVDTDGDGIPDTGSLAPGESSSIVVVATLPEDATGDNGGNGFDVTITATSGFDGNTDSTTATLGAIVTASVDLTADRSLTDGADANDGAGAGPEANPVRTNSTDPDSTTSFALVVNNTSDGSENYSLSETDLPAGWTVLYYIDNGDGVRNAADTPITDAKTGVIDGGGSRFIWADVTVPAGTNAADYDFTFDVTSPRSGSSDRLRNRVTVNAVPDVSLSNEGTGTVSRGGRIVYRHTLRNNGSTNESVTLSSTNSAAGWTSELFIDSNNNGELDADDELVDGPLDIAVGDEIELLVRVTAPADSDNGDQNTTSLSGSFSGGNTNSVDDVTTVSAGEAELVKEFALDSNCDGTADSAFSSDRGQAEPGQCVTYRLTGTNTGSTDLTDVQISDFTPEFTLYTDCGGSCPATASNGTLTAPANGSSGPVNTRVASLAAGASEVLTFTVQLEP